MKAALVFCLVLALLATAFAYKNEIIRNPALWPTESATRTPRPHEYLNLEELPKTWNWADPLKTGVVMTPVHNQHVPVYCGSCWAFGNASALSDRLAIQRKGEWPLLQISVQHILNCGHSAGTCNGGSSEGFLGWVHNNGISVYDCLNYEAVTGSCKDERAACKDCSTNWVDQWCWPIKNYTKIGVSEYGWVDGIDKIKAEIYARGPVSAGVNAEALLNITNTHYYVSNDDCQKFGPTINHVVELMGWETVPVAKYNEYGVQIGTEEKEYWIIKNSWGAAHGQYGLGSIPIGSNCIGIEDYVFFGVPTIINP